MVLSRLCFNELLSLPVLDNDQKLVGTISVLDILVYLSWSPFFEKGELNPVDVTSFKNLNTTVGYLLGLSSEGKNTWVIQPTSELKSLLEPFSKGLHRVLVPIKVDGKEVYRVVSQTDVLTFIYRKKGLFGEVISKKLSELGIKEKPVVSISTGTSALEGFKTMSLENVPAVAVVDAEKRIVANLSASDLRGINERILKKVVSPVTDYLKECYQNIRAPLVVTLDATLDEALDVIISEGIHRLWVVNQDKQVVGVLSLTDIIKLFL
uniref:CBS domain-containing protein n=1 Tax=Arcella intermedia TaxID=1963864 RepID=A0A6B2LC67_9EUKA